MTQETQGKTSTRAVRTDAFGRELKPQTYEMIPEINDKLRDTSKEFKLTASEVLEVLFAQTDWNALTPHLEEARQNKVKVRDAAKQARQAEATPKVMSLAKQLKDLSPEKLAEVQALIAKGNAPQA